MIESKLVTLKLIGFNDQESNNLQAILTLAGRALKKKWLVVTTDDADFFLLSVTASATANRAQNQENLPQARCLFCTPAPQIEAASTLLVDEKHVPRLSALVALFNQVTDNSQPVSEQPSSESIPQNPNLPSPIETTDSSAFFDPQQGLLGHLVTAEPPLQVICLTDSPAYPSLYINVEKNTYYSQNNLEQLSPYLAESVKLNSKACSKLEIQNYMMTEQLKPRSLKELIWYIVMKTSAGKLLKGHTHADIVMLNSWPDLRLFKCANYAKLATFMKNNAAPLEMIAEYTKIPVAEVHDFYNACYLMNLVEKKNQIEINKKNLSSERLDLLNKIDARLK